MNTFKYKPYYQYDGPTHSQPLREELPADEVANRLNYFFEEIDQYFDDDTFISKDVNMGVVTIKTELTQSECDDVVKKCLNSLDLFAKKLAAEC